MKATRFLRRLGMLSLLAVTVTGTTVFAKEASNGSVVIESADKADELTGWTITGTSMTGAEFAGFALMNQTRNGDIKFNLQEKTITVTGDVELKNDVEVYNGTLIINGNVTTTGDFVLTSSGTSTTVIVNGDYTQKAKDFGVRDDNSEFVCNNFSAINDAFMWHSGRGNITVKGDFTYNTTANSDYCGEVTWKIGGSIKQSTKASVGPITFATLEMTDAKAGQLLDVGDNVTINNLTTANPKITIRKYLGVKNYNNDLEPTAINGDLYVKYMTLNKDTKITIPGNMVAEGDVILNEMSSLVVNGKYTQNRADFGVRGDNASFECDEMVFNNDSFTWNSGKGSITVKGDFTYNATANSDHCGDVTWKIGGSIKQSTKSNVGPITFATLEMTDAKAGQLLDVGDNVTINNLTTANPKITIRKYLGVKNYNNDLEPTATNGDLYVKYMTLNKDTKITIPGNMVAEGDVILNEMSSLVVNGKYTQSKDDFGLRGDDASFECDEMVFNNDSFTWNSGKGNITIKGDFTYNATANSDHCGDVTWKIGGSIKQSTKSNVGPITFATLEMTDAKEGQLLDVGDNVTINNLTTANPKITIRKYLGVKNYNNDLEPTATNGDLYVKYMTLKGDVKITVPGNMVAEGDVILQDTSSLVVNGKHTQNAGDLGLRADNVSFTCDELVFNNDAFMWHSGKGSITVNGDFTYNSTGNSSSAGGNITWKIGGSIKQSTKANVGPIRFATLEMTDAKEGQLLDVGDNVSIQTLTTANPKITVRKYLVVDTYNNDLEPTATNGDLYVKAMTLKGNVRITVPGNMVAEGNVVLQDSSSLVVKGKYTQNAGDLGLRANNVSLTCDELVFNNDAIMWHSGKGNIIVNGDVTYNSTANSSAYGGEVAWKILGNLKQSEKSNVGAIRLYSVDMLTKGTSVVLPNGKIGTLTLESELENYTVTPANCYDKLIVPVSFKDVPDTAWYTEGVKFVNSRGIMTGYQGARAGEFGPKDNLTRAQFATMIHRMAGEPETTYVALFPDVPAGKFYSIGVTWCAQNKIITGYTSGDRSGQFGSREDDLIERQQVAAILYRYAKDVDHKDVSARASYADANIIDGATVSSYATDAMQWCVAMGIITGKDQKNGTYLVDPKGKATRAEAATMIVRYMNNVK